MRNCEVGGSRFAVSIDVAQLDRVARVLAERTDQRDPGIDGLIVEGCDQIARL